MDWYLELFPAFPMAGTVIWIQAYSIFRHKGIVSDQWWSGKPLVITNDPIRGVIEQPWDKFCAGQIPQPEGYPSQLSSYQVVARARSCLGLRYNWSEFNCDHLKNYAHGLTVESEQVKAVGSAIAFTALVAIAVSVLARAR